MQQQDKPAAKSKVFVSYSRRDEAFVAEVVEGLDFADFDVSIDSHSLQEGEAWRTRLVGLITEADTFVFIMSPASVVSEICLWELAKATELSKRVIPVLARSLEGKAAPESLASLHYVRFDDGRSFMLALRSLSTALALDLDWSREHTRLLTRALEWDNGGRPDSRLLVGNDIDLAKTWVATRPRTAPPPTELHLEFIRQSETIEAQRAGIERRRLEDMATAQAEREVALRAAEVAQTATLAASRRLVRRTVAGLIVALLLATAATGLGIFARHKQQEAVLHADKAKARLKSAIEVSNGFAIRTAALSKETGIAPSTVIALLEQAEGALLKLSETDQIDDPLLHYTLAMMSLEFGRSYKVLGNMDAWWSRTGDAVDRLRSTLLVEPSSALLQRGLALALGELATTYRDKGDTATTVTLLDEARRTQESLHTSGERETTFLGEMAANYVALSEVHKQRDDFEMALRFANRALEMKQSIADTSPTTPDLLREVSVAHVAVGNILHENDDYAGALKHYSQARAIREKLLADQPKNLDFTRMLSWALSVEGEALHETGRRDAALTNHRRAFDLRSGNLSRSPTNLIYKRDIAWSHFSFSESHRFAGQIDNATTEMTRAVALFRELYDRAPGDVGNQRRLGWSLRNLGRLQMLVDQFTKAEATLQEAAKLLKSAAEADRENMQWRYEYGVTLSDMGFTLHNKRNIRMAREMFAEARRILDELPPQQKMRAEKRAAREELARRLDRLAADSTQDTANRP